MLILSFLALTSLEGCVTRQEIDAVLFVNEVIPAPICEREPALKKLGIFRIFDCTQNLADNGVCSIGEKVRERISYCKPGIGHYQSIKDEDLVKVLQKAGIK